MAFMLAIILLRPTALPTRGASLLTFTPLEDSLHEFLAILLWMDISLIWVFAVANATFLVCMKEFSGDYSEE